MSRYCFEALVDGQWSREAAGQQDASNYPASREAAEAELPRLAETLECDVSEVRVVRVVKVLPLPSLETLRRAATEGSGEVADLGDSVEEVLAWLRAACSLRLSSASSLDDHSRACLAASMYGNLRLWWYDLGFNGYGEVLP